MGFEDTIGFIWQHLQQGLGEVFSDLFSTLLDPSKRLFGGFIVSSVLLVLWVYWRRGHLKSARLGSAFFSRKYWFNRSTLVDYGLLSGNALLRTLLIVPLFGSQLMIAIWVARILQANFDTPHLPDIHPLMITALYSLCFFLVEDFSRFLLHYAMHKLPVLWSFHKVHHGATTLTPFTLYRIHPFEMLLYYVRGMAVFGVMVGTFVYLFGAKVSAFEIMGVHVMGFLFNALGANLRHSHVWLSFGAWERVFISPAQHQIHHSRAAQHRDKNFGTCLAIWDRLFGSHVMAGRRKKLRFGVHSDAEAVST